MFLQVKLSFKSKAEENKVFWKVLMGMKLIKLTSIKTDMQSETPMKLWSLLIQIQESQVKFIGKEQVMKSLTLPEIIFVWSPTLERLLSLNMVETNHLELAELNIWKEIWSQPKLMKKALRSSLIFLTFKQFHYSIYRPHQSSAKSAMIQRLTILSLMPTPISFYSRTRENNFTFITWSLWLKAHCYHIVPLLSGYLKVKLLLPKIDKISMFGTRSIILKKSRFTTLREKLKELKGRMERLKFLFQTITEITFQLIHWMKPWSSSVLPYKQETLKRLQWFWTPQNLTMKQRQTGEL